MNFAFAGVLSLLDTEEVTSDDVISSELAFSLELSPLVVQEPSNRMDASIIIFSFFITFPREIYEYLKNKNVNFNYFFKYLLFFVSIHVFKKMYKIGDVIIG